MYCIRVNAELDALESFRPFESAAMLSVLFFGGRLMSLRELCVQMWTY